MSTKWSRGQTPPSVFADGQVQASQDIAEEIGEGLYTYPVGEVLIALCVLLRAIVQEAGLPLSILKDPLLAAILNGPMQLDS